jgi:succinate dehydrogenase / fumarate reductase cytochrome b subunit
MRARPEHYRYLITKNGPSKKGFASTQLLITGIVILIFLVIHVIQFKFGPGISDGYVVSFQGKEIRDLHRLVAETFRKNYWSAFYIVSVVLLGFHLRHGIWSLFQSLGATNPKTSGVLYYIGTGLSLIITVGFALMPVFFLLRNIP